MTRSSILSLHEYSLLLESDLSKHSSLLPELRSIVVNYLMPRLALDDKTWKQHLIHGALRSHIYPEICRRLTLMHRYHKWSLPFKVPDTYGGLWPAEMTGQFQKWWESMVNSLDEPLVVPAPDYWAFYPFASNVLESAKLRTIIDWTDAEDLSMLDTNPGTRRIVNTALTMRTFINLENGVAANMPKSDDVIWTSAVALELRIIGFLRDRPEVLIITVTRF